MAMSSTKEITHDSDAVTDEHSGVSSDRSGAIESAGHSRGNLGLQRWIQYVFVIGAAFTLWFLDKVATLVWQNFAEPPSFVITALAAVISIGGTIAVYRNERAQHLVTDVVT